MKKNTYFFKKWFSKLELFEREPQSTGTSSSFYLMKAFALELQELVTSGHSMSGRASDRKFRVGMLISGVTVRKAMK